MYTAAKCGWLFVALAGWLAVVRAPFGLHAHTHTYTLLIHTKTYLLQCHRNLEFLHGIERHNCSDTYLCGCVIKLVGRRRVCVCTWLHKCINNIVMKNKEKKKNTRRNTYSNNNKSWKTDMEPDSCSALFLSFLLLLFWGDCLIMCSADRRDEMMFRCTFAVGCVIYIFAWAAKKGEIFKRVFFCSS